MVAVLIRETQNAETSRFQGNYFRIYYLSLLAAIVTLLAVFAGKALSWLIGTIMALSFLGQTAPGTSTPADSGLGLMIICIPIVGAIAAILLAWLDIPLLKVLGLAIQTGTGAPLGAEGPVMLFGGALMEQITGLLRITTAECRILFIAGITGAISWYFGAPLAAACLALEVLLQGWILVSILPVAAAAVTGWIFYYLQHHTDAFFSLAAGPQLTAGALLVYILIGLLLGLMAAGIIKLSGIISNWFDHLLRRSRWWLLLAALVAGLAGYIAPEILGPGESYVQVLLQAHVTLELLFILSIIKLVPWLFFSAAGKTGTTVVPMLTIGGAAGLLLAFVMQLVFPAVLINPAMAALVGMAALFAGTTRALITAVILVLELTHQPQAWLPVTCAAVIAYGISWVLGKAGHGAV